MQSEKKEFERVQQNILDAINFCRGVVLDTFEVECGESNNWQSIRGRLLRCFGDRGLAGRVIEILDGSKLKPADEK